MYKKGLGAVVATSLLLVVGVVAVISFQSWYETFQSTKLVDVSQQSNDGLSSSIESLVGTNLYLKSKSNLSVTSVIINGINCNIVDNLSLGVDNLDISNCISNLSEGKSDILILTDKGTLQKVINLEFQSCGSTSHGSSSLYYNSTTGDSCYNETRTCNNGILDGDTSYIYSSCIEGPSVYFNSDIYDLEFGSSTSLTWSSNLMLNCTASGDWNGARNVSGNESTGSLYEPANYILTCFDGVDIYQKNVSINIHDPYWNDVVLLANFEGTNGQTTFSDSSLVGRTITRTGDPIISTSDYMFGSSSAYFDGTGSNAIDLGAPLSDFNPNGKNFTFEGWYKMPNSAGSPRGLLTSTQGQGGWRAYMGLFIRNTDDIILVSDDYEDNFVANTPINSWVHFALVQDLDNSQFRVYINGNLEFTESLQTINSNLDLELGNLRGSAGGATYYPFYGYIDEYRYTENVVRYSGSSFTVPISSFPQR